MAGRERRQVQQQGRASSKLKDWRSRPSASRVKHRQPANQGKPCPAVISKKLSRVWVGMSILPMPLINIENSRGSGIGLLRSIKIGQMLHAHSVQYAHKLSSSRYAIENKYTHHDLEPRNARSPPDQHQLHAYLPVMETLVLQATCLLFLILISLLMWFSSLFTTCESTLRLTLNSTRKLKSLITSLPLHKNRARNM